MTRKKTARVKPDGSRLWRLGTRRSPLAMAQALEARALLCAAHSLREEDFELVSLAASGDIIQDRPLAEIGGKALWTKELDRLLLAGDIDFAVHSAKDVETLRPEPIVIAAVLAREDVRDVLVCASGILADNIAALPYGARIGTSAPRRAAQLLHQRPDCRVVPFRGNVATRLKRLECGEADATLLARAGLNRLSQSNLGSVLDPALWLPAAGQGVIAIEARSDDAETLALLAAIDHAPSRIALTAERSLLAALGGNCHSALAVMTRHRHAMLHLTVALFSPDGSSVHRGDALVAPGDHAAIHTLASDLLTHAPECVARYFSASSCHATG